MEYKIFSSSKSYQSEDFRNKVIQSTEICEQWNLYLNEYPEKGKNELMAKIESDKENDFWGAYGELFSFWYLKSFYCDNKEGSVFLCEKLKNKRTPDFEVIWDDKQKSLIEVKTLPKLESQVPIYGYGCGGDGQFDTITNSLDTVGSQIDSEQNHSALIILVIKPSFFSPIILDPTYFKEALYGKEFERIIRNHKEDGKSHYIPEFNLVLTKYKGCGGKNENGSNKAKRAVNIQAFFHKSHSENLEGVLFLQETRDGDKFYQRKWYFKNPYFDGVRKFNFSCMD